MQRNRLTDTQVRNARPGRRQYKLSDGAGLCLVVKPNGSKWWRFDYRFQGLRKTISLGVYPDVPLHKARKKRDAAREQRADGIDPSEARKAEKRAQANTDSFEAVAREWYAQKRPGWAESHASKVLRRLERDVFPYIGRRPVDQIDAQELLRILRRIESRGTVDTAHRAKQNCSQVFRYAIATGRASHDPAPDLRDALKAPIPGSFASIKEPSAVGALLRAIDGYQGTLPTKIALQLAPLVFVRPGELRRAEWAEISMDEALWRIPAEKMKAKEPHLVPLSVQACDLIEQLRPVTGKGRYLFPGARSAKRPMSDNTLNAALRQLGYSGDEMTAHGFRSMASTLLNEQGWNPDAIECQLAHSDRSSIRAVYNYARYLPERRQMMQAWADYLDSLKRGADVVPLHGSTHTQSTA